MHTLVINRSYLISVMAVRLEMDDVQVKRAIQSAGERMIWGMPKLRTSHRRRGPWSGHVRKLTNMGMGSLFVTAFCHGYLTSYRYRGKYWAIPLFNRTPLQMTIIANVYPRDNL